MPGVLSQMLLSSTALPVPVPSVAQRVNGGGSARSTSTALAWAAATAGNLIVIEFACETNAASPSTPAGYSLWPDGNKSTGSNLTIGVFYKVAAGGETGVTFSHGNNETSWVMREVVAPVGTIDFGTSVVATTSTPDPPAVTPAAGGTKPTLNIAGAAFKTSSVSSYSSGYSNGLTGASTGANLDRVGSAEKISTSSSDDAGTLTLGASLASVAFSYSIR